MKNLYSKNTDLLDTQSCNQQEAFELLKKMWEIRIFEENTQKLFDAGKIYGTMHLCTGQEATAVGAAGQLMKEDWMVSTHRNHGHCIAKGTDIRAMFAELMGKKTGTNEGKGGSMHIADLEVGNLGSNGIVGAGFPIAAGAALTAKLKQTNQVVLCYAGDGSINEGSFHEALNLASIWQLPVIYFIENNQYGMSSSIDQMVNIKHLSTRGESYGIEGITIDGNDIFAVRDTIKYAINKARTGGGPTLIEGLTYRYNGHSKSDKMLYRSKKECLTWQETKDPITRLEQAMIQNGQATQEELRELEEKIRDEMDQMIASVYLDEEPSEADLFKHVYAGENL